MEFAASSSKCPCVTICLNALPTTPSPSHFHSCHSSCETSKRRGNDFLDRYSASGKRAQVWGSAYSVRGSNRRNVNSFIHITTVVNFYEALWVCVCHILYSMSDGSSCLPVSRSLNVRTAKRTFRSRSTAPHRRQQGKVRDNEKLRREDRLYRTRILRYYSIYV
jgi:hypothetical protein